MQLVNSGMVWLEANQKKVKTLLRMINNNNNLFCNNSKHKMFFLKITYNLQYCSSPISKACAGGTVLKRKNKLKYT